MTLVAGRIPGLLPMQRSHYEDSGTQGILKTRRSENMRAEDNRRLVRFSEASEVRPLRGGGGEGEAALAALPSVITFGNNTYLVDSSDPNSAVRKLFPNSKLVPIAPLNPTRERRGEEIQRRVDRGCPRSVLKAPVETRLRPKSEESLVERIKRLTCEDADKEWKFDTKTPDVLQDLPKQTKEGLNLMRYRQSISRPRSPEKTKTSPTDKARRSFLSSLSQEENTETPASGGKTTPGDRTSVATDSTAADTVYSLSDIEEALTEEEKEIKEAFANEIRQDELELFVQQGAGRTERLRRRYGAKADPSPKAFNFHQRPAAVTQPQGRRDKPRFGSTVEILQQLQQQIESPYQLEGRRTACSNYSDSSMAVSDRFYDDYEPIARAIAHRTCSLDSKNYEEIESFPAFPARARSQEHPRLARLESDPYVYASIANASVYHGDRPGRSQPLPLDNVYVSSPDLGYRAPERQLCRNQTLQRLHPVLQRQYCRYPTEPKPEWGKPEGGKVLTPPVRMHTYMNIPSTAPCYSPPPPYSRAPRPYSDHPPGVYPFDSGQNRSVYQNVPIPSHLTTLRRLCTERERGVPEGASEEIKESFHQEYFLPSQVPMPKPPMPHQYCVDV